MRYLAADGEGGAATDALISGERGGGAATDFGIWRADRGADGGDLFVPRQ